MGKVLKSLENSVTTLEVKLRTLSDNSTFRLKCQEKRNFNKKDAKVLAVAVVAKEA